MSKRAENNWHKTWSKEAEQDCSVALQHLASAVYVKWRDAINSETKYPDLVGLGQIHDFWNMMYEDMKAIYTLEQLVGNNYRTRIIEGEEDDTSGGTEED